MSAFVHAMQDAIRRDIDAYNGCYKRFALCSLRLWLEHPEI
jgi:hypothetical protein